MPVSVLPRSGLAREHGIALVNSPGLIDSGYRGEVRVLLLNTDPAETFRVAPGERIAQLVISPIALAGPVEAREPDRLVPRRRRLRLQRPIAPPDPERVESRERSAFPACVDGDGAEHVPTRPVTR